MRQLLRGLRDEAAWGAKQSVMIENDAQPKSPKTDFLEDKREENQDPASSDSEPKGGLNKTLSGQLEGSEVLYEKSESVSAKHSDPYEEVQPTRILEEGVEWQNTKKGEYSDPNRIPFPISPKFLDNALEQDLLIRQTGKTHAVKSGPFKDSADVIDWLQSKKHIGLRVSPLNLVCVDIDDPILGAKIEPLLKQYEGLSTTSPNGRHIFFNLSSEDKERFGSYKSHHCLFAGGFCGELRMNFVTFLGPGYLLTRNASIESLESLTELGGLPEFLWPIKKLPLKTIQPIFTKENGYQLLDGFRNISLFKWGSTLKGICERDSVRFDIQEILEMSNLGFCNPPLDSKEMSTICGSVDKLEEDKTQRIGRLSPSSKLAKVMTERYKNKLFYAKENDSWYQWNGIFWEKLDTIDIRGFILDLIKELSPGTERISTINDTLALISIELKRSLKESTPSHTNFLNGVFDLKTQTLKPHDPALNFTHVVRVNFQPGVFPDKELQGFLLSLTGNNPLMLELLRGGVRRAIEPAVVLQTGFWIYGPPGTGKSTFMSWLQHVVPDRTVELSCSKANIFERGRLLNASLVIISDGEAINLETSRLLRVNRTF